ncbi:hypothetical protein M407DRAFT_243515 [Tulasnella calospora MUT 4182]|uniref:ABM domain-containing protein n=1 Tax=Tulasnella calospora MUT 4182 TaxID=1051891 RepID=A0A0C3KZW4_9AGAM|nr:hypothetical protein M407DRAFT_243515 [Tulasnella calospora MUT 4182]
MSSSPDAIDGKIIVHVRMKAKPGRADELLDALLKVKASVESDAEPGGITFRFARFEDEILIFEEYESAAALGPHSSTEVFYELQKVGAECRDGDAQVLFYQEVGV